MAAKPAPARGVPPAVMALCVVVLVAFISWVGYANLAPHAQPLQKTTVTETDRWIAQKAHESGGDANKLAPEDQQKLNTLTRGMGSAALQMVLKNGQP